MRKESIIANIELPFPLQGKNENYAASKQPPQTSPDLNNVRPYDVSDTRARGGQRPGLEKWGDGDQIGAAEQPVVAICVVHTVI